jgi:hypothetical protein
MDLGFLALMMWRRPVTTPTKNDKRIQRAKEVMIQSLGPLDFAELLERLPLGSWPVEL